MYANGYEQCGSAGKIDDDKTFDSVISCVSVIVNACLTYGFKWYNSNQNMALSNNKDKLIYK